ncbi:MULTISPECIES: NAD-dependent epimerase/dehydratase family protein [Streptomyces]|uniref:NAD-dependent epimerase/dehydratase family protein n=1 Tax=Streptomyces solicathayae TaxID=3081768 RepID=A0ABZ0M229_9ACTN|nr:NAD-dependent epimerase/dehydratase family protein [Streptomyces sp. HUAS YS2]WOX25713.1 NAD-dependent epimerase/dehydratase family protein [Streptomyces sp. HUAS YS2]
MAKGHAFVLGATGQVGRAAVRALAADGWEVTAGSRRGGRGEDRPEIRSVSVDRNDEGALAAALGDGVDVLVDIVAYDAGHGRQLTALADRIGSAVVISSGAVYEDDRGRSFDTQQEPDGFPRYPVPIPETLTTVAPGPSSYSTRKIALERELLAAGGTLPTTLVRAGAIHGPYCPGPREAWFVKRALDGRPVRLLAHGGAARFHPAHVDNLAELIRLAAASPGTRVLNGADPEAPTIAEIGAAIDAVMGVASEQVLIPGEPEGTVGLTPWSSAHPIVYDMTAAERELGYRPVVSYADSLPATVEWLAGELTARDWRDAFPGLVKYGLDFFDYAAEDAWLAARD